MLVGRQGHDQVQVVLQPQEPALVPGAVLRSPPLEEGRRPRRVLRIALACLLTGSESSVSRSWISLIMVICQ
jgi:hypothetical protein